ncbi:MAG: hypothetical protein Q9162_004262 [Coniocarpon cinnabarinum]
MSSEVGGVHNVGSKADFDQALKDNQVVVVDFFATWCGPCKVVAPKVVEMSNSDSYKEKARFLKIDVDEVPDVAQEYSVKAMPTFMVFKDGEKVQEVVGANVKALENAVGSAV